MRGDSYVTKDGEAAQDTVTDELRQLIKAGLKRNGKGDGDASDEEVDLLRKLYEQIVPSSIGNKGTAQDANACSLGQGEWSI